MNQLQSALALVDTIMQVDSRHKHLYDVCWDAKEEGRISRERRHVLK
jgi:hypothetical protein